MNVLCTACNSRYSIADSLIPPQGARFKCRRCSAVIAVSAPVIELAPTELEVIPPPAPAPVQPKPAPPRPAAEPFAAPSFEEPPSTPGFGPSGPPMTAVDRPDSPAFERNEPASRPAFEQAPAETMPPLPPEPAFQQGFYSEPTPPPIAERPPTLQPASEPMTTDSQESPFDRMGTPPQFSARPSFAEPAPPPVPPAPARPAAPSEPAMPAFLETPRAPAAQSPSATVATPAAPSAPAAPAASTAPAAPAASTVPAVGGTPIPEGLSPEERAKHEKARRLARVLASDIAIYNRDKRERGIKDGNLVAVLGYEIKKSWEIYKERVTPEFANATPYFRDALNEMLAEGKKIF